MQHIGKNAMLRPLRSISLQFLLISGTVFDPKTLQNELWDPTEKNTKFEHPFFEFFLNFWPPWAPKFHPKTIPIIEGFHFWGQLGSKVGPGTPRTQFWLISGRFLLFFTDFTTRPTQYSCFPGFGGAQITSKIESLNPLSLKGFDEKRCVF